MSDPRHPDDKPLTPASQTPGDADEPVDSVGLPNHDLLGLNPGDANDETEPGADPVPHGG